MSTKAGEGKRTRSQKHQNSTVWKFDKFKTDPKSKIIKSLTVVNCCSRCTQLLEWKIKYGKYKPLTKPAKCSKCHEKRVKSAYHIICIPCVVESGNCAKCGGKKEVVNLPTPEGAESAKLDAELQRELKALPERKRRTFLRYLRQQEKGTKTGEALVGKEPNDKAPEATETPLFDAKVEAIKYLKELTAKFAKEEDFDIDLDQELEDLYLDDDDESE